MGRMNHRMCALVIAAPALNLMLVADLPAASAVIRVPADAIGGTVVSANGPEAGVWVIAETSDFQTRFAKIVVTDDRGRYLIPDLPQASYQLWVRGYGLADSSKVPAKRGKTVALMAVIAPSAASAAQIYPAAYWYAMMKLPQEADLAQIPDGLDGYLLSIKNMSCIRCHQLGDRATRTISSNLGKFDSSQQAWMRRIQSGQSGSDMVASAMGSLHGVPIKYLADWTDRIAAGELPAQLPPRPSGIERDVVVTVRDWSDPKSYLHDLSGTDRNNPTVNAYGSLYGSPEMSSDNFPILDPVRNVATSFRAPVRDADTPSTHDAPVIAPSPYWGEERIWDSKATAHNPMLDHLGRVWYTARIRGLNVPAFCKADSGHPSAKLFPLEQTEFVQEDVHGHQLAVYEPKSGKYTFIDTCYSTHHLQFSPDNHTLWTSGGQQVIGWLDTDKFDQTGDAAAAQRWAPFVLDIRGTGKLDRWVEPDQPIRADRDKRLALSIQSVMPNPADGSVWGAQGEGEIEYEYRGAIVRFDPRTMLTEIYHVPAPGFGVSGADIDSNGVVWVVLASGQLASFDRRRCKGALNGPTATGDQCPEGWTFYRLPGPGFAELPQVSVESSYYAWVDQHNTLGLGENVPMATGNLSDGIHALVNGKFLTLRVPYPLGFYTKGMDGRIDDVNAGWKGRGIWATEGDRTPSHKEGGGKPVVVQFQVRPDPLSD
jgi:hypothetical protein